MPLRLVLATRRFWPLLGGAERAMANLATGLAACGCRVTVLTARWDPSWPAALVYTGVPVVRLTQPARRTWGTVRYMAALAHWLRSHRRQFDLVCVSMLKHDAYAALAAVGRSKPVVLRAEGGGASGDCRWQDQQRFGSWIRRRCRRAAAVVAPSLPIEEELLAAGYPRQRVHWMPNGVATGPAPSPQRKAAARQVLAVALPLLYLPPETPLAVYTGRLHPGKGLECLLTAWQAVAARLPLARLWLVGDGPLRPALERQIAAFGLHGRVVLAGSFDSVDEMLSAADLFVLPSREEGMSLALLEAMGAGLPVVTTDIPGNRALVEPERHGLLVPVGDAQALSAAILRLVDQPELGVRLGAAARQRVADEFTLARMVDAHLRLFRSLTSSSKHPDEP